MDLIQVLTNQQIQSYAHFILPYQIIKENEKTLLKVIVGFNVEDTVIMSIDLQNQQVHQFTIMVQFLTLSLDIIIKPLSIFFTYEARSFKWSYVP